MPELPEVETIARQLQELIVGRRVAGFESFWHRVTEQVPAAHFATRLSGREITGVGRRGKFVVLELGGDEALIVSLRMTGKLLFRERNAPEDTFVRALITFADGTVLRFSDTRKFGRMAIVDRADLSENGERPRARVGDPLHSALGIEPLTARFTTRWLREFLQKRAKSAIKPLLLDQRGIAGVGNIYDVEALWRARIHPLRTAGSLRADEVARLREALRFALRKGIRLGGASRRDYLDARGGQGRMQREFQVYDRAGEPCPRCGRAIVRTVVGGRGTFHCPRCQKAPVMRAKRRRIVR
jgi:formamidopyrimidine-DNA glycosylase